MLYISFLSLLRAHMLDTAVRVPAVSSNPNYKWYLGDLPAV